MQAINETCHCSKNFIFIFILPSTCLGAMSRSGNSKRGKEEWRNGDWGNGSFFQYDLYT